ncbi:MAG TPA: acetyl-CoA carboxylase biotin carboxyl carrier protein subunit, partial [Rhodanobacter sp.]
MADLKQVLVPDVGHADVPVIEVMVKVGDHV